MEKDALLQGEMIGIRCANAKQNPVALHGGSELRR
jgi:hypothetical protein